MDHFVLIDGNSLVNRAFYATPAFTTSDGLPTNGVYGFIRLALKIVSDLRPNYFVVAFDLPAPTFRHKMFDRYKGTRKPMPEELAVQIPILKETLDKMGIRIVQLEGYEADDVIGTLAKRFPVHTVIYTGDRDSYQLVDDTTDVYFTKRGVTDLLKLTAENFKAEIGLTPRQIIDLKALMGDSSDNIPGVPGVGEKTAFRLVQEYGSLENVYEHLDEQTKALREKLEKGRESALLSKTLATIDTDIPLSLSLEQCAFSFPFPASLKEQFAKLQFRTFLESDIYEKEEKPARAKAELCTDISRLVPLSEDANEIAFYYDGDMHFAFDDTELFLKVKQNLLDEGYAADDCLAAAKKVLTGQKRIVFYDYKAQRHLLNKIGLDISCPYEDAAMLRYLVDSDGAASSLTELMQVKLLPKEAPALAVKQLYRESLSQADETTRRLYRSLELPLSEVLYDMEETGVRLDIAELDAFSRQYAAEAGELETKITEIAGGSFNLNSPAQLGQVLFETLRLPAPKKTKSGGYPTNAEVLEKLEDHEIVRLIQRYRFVKKLNSTYVEGFRPLVDENGRVHTTYNQLLTTTGRLSSSNPNLQNIPTRNEDGKELRKLFLASEGNVLIDADYSQIELRLLAHFSECPELIAAYQSGADIHALTASQITGTPIDQVTKEQRRRAKAVNFGIIYGISAFGLAKDLHISAREAAQYIDRYFESYSSVKEYMEANVAFAKEHGYVTTLLGRKRVINELRSSNYAVRSFGERAAMNMPLQGSSADIIKIAMLRVYERLRREGLRAKLILQVHDELVVDTPVEEKDAVREILRYEMEHAAELKVPLSAEVGEGKSWYDAK